MTASSDQGLAPQAIAPRQGWTFLTNHAHVLITLARDPDLRLRDIRALVGITERTTHVIVSELERDGYLTTTKKGRRNHEVNTALPLRHPLEQHHRVGELLDAVAPID
ncbi:MAG: helix-turn-helix transcriptional regulator [Gaiellaceae bacterium]